MKYIHVSLDQRLRNALASLGGLPEQGAPWTRIVGRHSGPARVTFYDLVCDRPLTDEQAVSVCQEMGLFYLRHCETEPREEVEVLSRKDHKIA